MVVVVVVVYLVVFYFLMDICMRSLGVFATRFLVQRHHLDI